MCGRYYVDDETSREIEKIVRKLDQRLKIVKTKKNILFKVQSRMPHYLWQGVIKSIMVKIVL